MTPDEAEPAADPIEPTFTGSESTEAESTGSESTGSESTRVKSRGRGAFERVRNWGRWVSARSDRIAWWSNLGVELVVFSVCMVMVVVYRLLTLEQIEVGGDALKVWEFARHLAYGGDFPDKLNHHTSRFGLVIPSYLVQKIFGSSATSYYIGPLFASITAHALAFLIARRFAGLVAGVVTIVLLLQFSHMERARSQILPETFGPMYVAAAYYAAFWYTSAKKRWTRGTFLTLTAAFMFMAYGAKMVYLYYAPGLALVVWLGDSRQGSSDLGQPEVEPKPGKCYQRAWRFLVKKRLVVPAALALLVVGFILVESVFLSAKTGVSSHFSLVSGSHGVVTRKGAGIQSVEDFFALYTRAPDDWVQALSIGAVAVLGVLAYGRSKLAGLYALSLLIFALLQTFVVRRLDPITPWTEPHPRYLIAMAVPLAILIAIFVVCAATKVLISKGERSEKLWVRGLRGGARLGVIFAILYVFQYDLGERWDKEWGKKDNWHRTEELAAELSEAFAQGLPIVSPTGGGKPAWAAGAVYVEPTLLISKGELLSHRAFMRKFQRGKYLARAVAQPKMRKKRLDAWVKHRVSTRQCVVIMRQTARFMTTQRHMGRDCRPLAEHANERPPGAQKKPRRRASQEDLDAPHETPPRRVQEVSPVGP